MQQCDEFASRLGIVDVARPVDGRDEADVGPEMDMDMDMGMGMGMGMRPVGGGKMAGMDRSENGNREDGGGDGGSLTFEKTEELAPYHSYGHLSRAPPHYPHWEGLGGGVGGVTPGPLMMKPHKSKMKVPSPGEEEEEGGAFGGRTWRERMADHPVRALDLGDDV